MKTIYLSFLTFFLAVSYTHAQSETSYSTETAAEIKQVEENLCTWVKTQDIDKWTLEERMEYYGVNGVSIAVVKDYKILWAKGYGFADVSEKRKVDENTLFQAASISKSLNALGVLKLAQDKKIDLDSDINNYLKSWKFPYDTLSKGKKITVANLLSHTGGTTVHGFPGYTPGKKLPSTINILNGEKPANTEAVRSEAVPGEKFNYSGGGTTITQLIITDVAGQTYADYMWQNVLQPIGMTASSYDQPSKKPASLLATGYYTDGTKIKGKYHVYPEQAAAGLWTTPADLCKYIIEMQLSLKGNSNKVLTQENTNKMVTPVLPKSEAGLGVFIEKKGSDSYFQHGGANEGFRCQYYGSLENGNGVVVMVNSDNGSIINEIINSVAQTYNWPDYYEPVTKTVVSLPENTLNEYAGKYKNDEASFSIIKKDGNLYIQLRDVTQRMYFTSETEFFRMENPNSPKFIRSEEGKVKGIMFNGSFFVPKV